VEPSSPNPISRRRRGAKPILFSCPLSYGRGARGEGFTDFHVTPVNYAKIAKSKKQSFHSFRVRGQ
jgi:hypothetical protein